MSRKRSNSVPTALATSAPAARRRVHPVTWAAAAVLLPLACWDALQAQHDVTLRRQAAVQHIERLPPLPSVTATPIDRRIGSSQQVLAGKPGSPAQTRSGQPTVGWLPTLD